VTAVAGGLPAGVIWHDVECGGYSADLGLWEELAGAAGGPVLDLGCGTGRVGLCLARRGHEVLGVDSDAELVAEFKRRAGGMARAEAVIGDARRLDLEGEFPLALAPMQLAQLLADGAERRACLGGIAAHLAPGGIAALAIVEDVLPESEYRGGELPLPDTREVEGRVYSSLPLPTVVSDEAILVRRLRQTVSPDGSLDEEEGAARLRPLGAAQLEREGAEAGLEPLPRRFVPPTADHLGSTVVVLRKGAS
jgi:SAM-dependent methyltransferase